MIWLWLMVWFGFVLNSKVKIIDKSVVGLSLTDDKLYFQLLLTPLQMKPIRLSLNGNYDSWLLTVREISLTGRHCQYKTVYKRNWINNRHNCVVVSCKYKFYTQLLKNDDDEDIHWFWLFWWCASDWNYDDCRIPHIYNKLYLHCHVCCLLVGLCYKLNFIFQRVQLEKAE